VPAGGAPAPAAFARLAGAWKLLYVGQYYPHKNLEAAIRLFRECRDELRDVVLVTTIDARLPGAARFLRDVKRYGLEDHIVNVGPVPHDELAAYYENADAFFMPTLLETFCIPYLEAMCFELPVLTSDLDFAHEVCGQAALYFDPWDARSMRDTILRLRADAALRGTLVAAGQERLRRDFPDWETRRAGECWL
jgi:glycosyltransferase involved in cell wall biosynthesis